jgi:hypothetical protein
VLTSGFSSAGVECSRCQMSSTQSHFSMLCRPDCIGRRANESRWSGWAALSHRLLSYQALAADLDFGTDDAATTTTEPAASAGAKVGASSRAAKRQRGAAATAPAPAAAAELVSAGTGGSAAADPGDSVSQVGG